MSERAAVVRDRKRFYSEVLQAMEPNARDLPVIAIYSSMQIADDQVATVFSTTFEQQGSVGLTSKLETLGDSQTNESTLMALFEKAFRTGESVLLEDDSVPKELLNQGSSRGWCEVCDRFLICPIKPNDQTDILLLIGLNPRRPYDPDYQHFVQLLCRQIAAGLAAVTLAEDQAARAQRLVQLAELERNQFEMRTAAAEQSENDFREMANLAPDGMFRIAMDGGTFSAYIPLLITKVYSGQMIPGMRQQRESSSERRMLIVLVIKETRRNQCPG